MLLRRQCFVWLCWKYDVDLNNSSCTSLWNFLSQLFLEKSWLFLWHHRTAREWVHQLPAAAAARWMKSSHFDPILVLNVWKFSRRYLFSDIIVFHLLLVQISELYYIFDYWEKIRNWKSTIIWQNNWHYSIWCNNHIILIGGDVEQDNLLLRFLTFKFNMNIFMSYSRLV